MWKADCVFIGKKILVSVDPGSLDHIVEEST